MSSQTRYHALDAVRAFALLLGVVFHAGFSFIPGMIPGVWAMVDSSPSAAISGLLFVSHIFRMSLFFLIAGFFARMLFHRAGARGFWLDRSKRILIPMIVGWLVLAPTIAVVWIWGITKTFGGTLPAPPATAPPAAVGAFPLTHLWFLYYLLILYVIVLVCRSTIVALDRGGVARKIADVIVRGLVRSGAAALVAATPVAAALYLRGDWMIWFGIPTPDQSLIPQFTSLVAYGAAMTFGWLMQRHQDLLGTWAAQWKWHLAGAVAATGVCLSIAGVSPVFAPAEAGWQKLVFASGYAVAIWCWNFAIIGLALRFMSRPNSTVRYVADASYWIYLVHLPLVAAMQVVVGHLPWHWSIKLPVILLVSLAALLLSYRYLVRPTFIGQVLNGRRRQRGIEPGPGPGDLTDGDANSRSSDASPTTSRQPRASHRAEPLAELRGVHKKYGSVVALDGIDLDVRRGELFAVLGPNGAGKSTAIALWLGLMEPDSGDVQLFDKSPQDVSARRNVGVMMQDVGLAQELRVRELIALTSSYYPDPLTAIETLELTRIESLANRPYGKLSAGQKRQVQFALAVCGRPPLLFLDEPTVGLDLHARENMWRMLRSLVAQGSSVVLTTHYLEEAEALADRVAVLAGGRLIASGSVDSIRALVVRSHITCTTALALDDVRAWPEVAVAACEARRLSISTTHAEAVVRRLLAADQSIADLEVRRASLADAFADLTKEAA